VSKRSGFYPCPAVDTAGSNVVSQAGGLLLTEAVRAVGLDRALSAALAPWRGPNAVHAGEHAPDHHIHAGAPLVIDVDATLVTAHSDKEGAAPTFKRGFGHHPLWAFVDGPDGTGEPLSVLLRPGNAGSNTAADHITVLRDALRQLSGHRPGTRPGRKILIRADAAGCTHDLLDGIVGQRLSYSVGVHPARGHHRRAREDPAAGPATGLRRRRRTPPGSLVLEVTGLLDLRRWPRGMRVIVRRERPHPGAQLQPLFQPNVPVRSAPTGGRDCESADISRGRLRQRRLDVLDATRSRAAPALIGTAAEPADAGPNRRRCATGCCMSPPGSPADNDGCSSVSTPPGRGVASSPPRSPASTPCPSRSPDRRHLPDRP
jgi:hypothetical protein